MSVEELKAKEEKARKDLAACYARVFLGNPDGQRVLNDMRSKFGVERPSFRRQPGQQYNALEAALNEGNRQVMADIEAALKSCNPQLWAASLI